MRAVCRVYVQSVASVMAGTRGEGWGWRRLTQRIDDLDNSRVARRAGPRGDEDDYGEGCEGDDSRSQRRPPDGHQPAIQGPKPPRFGPSKGHRGRIMAASAVSVYFGATARFGIRCDILMQAVPPERPEGA